MKSTQVHFKTVFHICKPDSSSSLQKQLYYCSNWKKLMYLQEKYRKLWTASWQLNDSLLMLCLNILCSTQLLVGPVSQIYNVKPQCWHLNFYNKDKYTSAICKLHMVNHTRHCMVLLARLFISDSGISSDKAEYSVVKPRRRCTVHTCDIISTYWWSNPPEKQTSRSMTGPCYITGSSWMVIFLLFHPPEVLSKLCFIIVFLLDGWNTILYPFSVPNDLLYEKKPSLVRLRFHFCLTAW